MSGERVARNVLVTVVTQIISWALSFAVTLYLPRYAGDSGLGRLTLAMSLVSLFALAAPLGTTTVLIKEVARDHNRTGALLGAALALRIPLVLVAVVLTLGITAVLGYDRAMLGLVVAYAAAMVISNLNEAFGAALQGLERMPRQNAAMLAEKLANSGLVIALIFLGAPLWTLAAVGIVSALPSFAINVHALRGPLREALSTRPSRALLRTVAIAGLPFMGWSLFRGFYEQINPIALSLVASVAVVGWYAAAAKLVGSTLFVPYAITSALLPTLTRLWTEDQERFARLARRMFALVMLLAMPISLLLLCLPQQVIALLHYGREFDNSIPVLRLGGPAALFYFASFALGTTIIAADRQQAMFRGSIAALLLGLPACVLGALLSGRLTGNAATGAMAGNVALEAFLVVWYLREMPIHLIDRRTVSQLARYALATVPTGMLLAYLVNGRGAGLWAVAPCAALYGGLCIALGAVDPEVFELVRRRFVPARVPVASEGGATGR